MLQQIDISIYRAKDTAAIAKVYHAAVWALTTVNMDESAPDASEAKASAAGARPLYTHAQCQVWSGNVRDKRYWRSRLLGSLVLVAKHNNEVVGFIECELGFKDRGYIGYCYVAPRWQQRGIAGQLLETLIQMAPCYGVKRLSTDASKASRALFAANGFADIGRSYQQKCGQVLPGYSMQRQLPFYITPVLDTKHYQSKKNFPRTTLSPTELGSVALVFHRAVQDADEYYTTEQRRAWSPRQRSADEWLSRLDGTWVWLAKTTGEKDEVVGFINLKLVGEGDAEVDYLYVEPQMQRCGIGLALFQTLLRHAQRLMLQTLTVNASYAAKALFVRQGFVELSQNQHQRDGELLVNFTLQKALVGSLDHHKPSRLNP